MRINDPFADTLHGLSTWKALKSSEIVWRLPAGQGDSAQNCLGGSGGVNAWVSLGESTVETMETQGVFMFSSEFWGGKPSVLGVHSEFMELFMFS